MQFEINNFPMPPSVNKLYAYTGSRVVKTKVYRKFDEDVRRWRYGNDGVVRQIREFIVGLKEHVIHIDTYFHMGRASVLTKEGKPKRNDTSNRIKALHDVLAEHILGIDDCYFWSGSFEKVVLDGANEQSEHVRIVLKFRTV